MEKSHVFLDIAGLLIDFSTRHPEYIRERCCRYLAAKPNPAENDSSKPILHLEAKDEDIRKSDRDNVGESEAASTDADRAKLTVEGNVTLEGYYYGIAGNGTRHNTDITISGEIRRSCDCERRYN